MAKSRINTQADVEAIKKLIVEFKGLSKQLKTTTQTLSQLQNTMTVMSGVSNQTAASYANLNQQLKNMTKSQRNYKTQLKNQKEATKQLADENEKLNQKLKKVQNTQKQSNSIFKTMLGSVKNLIAAFGIISGIQIFANILRESYAVLKEFDAISFAMEKISRSTMELVDSQKFLTTITQQFGIDIVSTTQRYLKFLASANQVGLSLKQTQRIFESVSKASAVLGLRTDELTGVYLALEQMLSKGKVTTEELRRQLGERLPGAMGIMADAMGVSISTLDKMMKKGEVLSSEALPKFAVALEEAYGLNSVSKINTLQSAQTRLTNTWGLIIDKIRTNTSVTQVLINSYNSLTNALQSIFNLTKEIEGESSKRIRQIRQESDAYNTLAQEILQTNNDEERRLDLIGKMVEEYPFMLQYLDDEKISNEKLREALREVNSLYIKRIALSKLQKQLNLEETTQRVASAKAAEAVATTNLRNAISRIVELSRGQITEEVFDEQDVLKSAENTMKKLEALELKFTKERNQKAVAIIQKQMKVLQQYQKEYKGARNILGFDEKDLQKIQAELKKLEKELGITADQLEDFFNKEDGFSIRIKLNEDKKGAKAKIDTSDLDLELEILKGMLEDYQRKMEGEENLSQEIRLKMFENFYDTREDILKTQREKEIRLAGDNDTKKIQAEEKYQNAIKALQSEEALQRINFLDQMLGDELRIRQAAIQENINKEIIELRKAFVKKGDFSVTATREYNEKIKNLEIKMQNEGLESLANYIKKYIEKHQIKGALATALWQEYYDLLAQMRNEDNRQEEVSLQRKYELLNQFTQKIFDIAQSFTSRRLEQIEAEIKAEEYKYDKMIELAENDASKKAVLEDEKEKRIAQLEKKRLKEEQRQARIKKAAAISEIAINTAIGISNATKKGFLGIPEKIWVAAIGALQTAAVLAQPIPQYKDGVKNLGQDEIAMINDGGKKEYVERNGQILSTDTKNAIVQLKKGDTVHKDYDSMVKESILYNLIAQGQPLSQSKFDSLGDVIQKGIERGFKTAKIENNITFNHRSRNEYLNSKARR